jgi:hypothetical protein
MVAEDSGLRRRWISENSKANRIETMKGPAETGGFTAHLVPLNRWGVLVDQGSLRSSQDRPIRRRKFVQ